MVCRTRQEAAALLESLLDKYSEEANYTYLLNLYRKVSSPPHWLAEYWSVNRSNCISCSVFSVPHQKPLLVTLQVGELFMTNHNVVSRFVHMFSGIHSFPDNLKASN